LTGGRQRVRVHFQLDGVFLAVGVDDDVGRLHLNGGRDRHLKHVLRIADLYLPVLLLLLLLLLHLILDAVMVPMHVHVLELVVVMVVMVLQVHVVGHGQRVSHHVARLLERQQRLVLVVRGRRPGLGLVVVFVEHHRLVERTLVHGWNG